MNLDSTLGLCDGNKDILIRKYPGCAVSGVGYVSARVTIETWPTPETAQDKPLVPRVIRQGFSKKKIYLQNERLLQFCPRTTYGMCYFGKENCNQKAHTEEFEGCWGFCELVTCLCPFRIATGTKYHKTRVSTYSFISTLVSIWAWNKREKILSCEFSLQNSLYCEFMGFMFNHTLTWAEENHAIRGTSTDSLIELVFTYSFSE